MDAFLLNTSLINPAAWQSCELLNFFGFLIDFLSGFLGAIAEQVLASVEGRTNLRTIMRQAKKVRWRR